MDGLRNLEYWPWQTRALLPSKRSSVWLASLGLCCPVLYLYQTSWCLTRRLRSFFFDLCCSQWLWWPLPYWAYYTVVSSACLHIRGDSPDRSWHSSKVSGFSSSALLSPLASLAKCFMVMSLFEGNFEKLLSPCRRHTALWHSSSAPLCPVLSCVEPKGCYFLSPVPIVSLNMKKWGRNLKDSQGNKSVNEFWFQCKVMCSWDKREWQSWMLLWCYSEYHIWNNVLWLIITAETRSWACWSF